MAKARYVGASVLAVVAFVAGCARQAEMQRRAVETGMPPAAPTAPGLPNPPPVFKASAVGRTTPLFSVEEFPDRGTEMAARPVYRVGHKMVTTRLAQNRPMKNQAHAVKIYAADKELCSLMWWGDAANGGGWPFALPPGESDALTMDPATGVTTYVKPYRTADGTLARFTYRLKPLGPGRVELAWDSGSDAGAALWVCFAGADHRGKRIAVGGRAIVASAVEALSDKRATPQTFDGGDLTYNADDPLNGFTLELGGRSGSTEERLELHDKGMTQRFYLNYRTTDRKGDRAGRVVIDLGEAELAGATPPPVGGIDFWKDDATHVPLAPTRNVMLNPSFEQGLRGWYWIAGGARYTPTNAPKYEIVREGVVGPCALRMNRVQMTTPGLRSMPLALESGRRYVASFYAKSVIDKTTDVHLGLANAARGGTLPDTPWGDVEVNPDARFTVTGAWQRFHRRFTADGAGLALILRGSGVLIDGVQVEAGDAPTAFVCAPLDVNFVTSTPDNDLRPGVAPDAALAVVGKAGTRGKIAIEIQNAFREKLFAHALDVALPASGEARLPLDIDAAALGVGVFVVKATMTVEGCAPYCDYYRFTIMEPLANRHPTSRLMGTLVADAWRISRGEDLARKLMEWGWGGTSWVPIHDIIETNNVGVELLRRYRIVNAQTPLVDYLLHVAVRDDPKLMSWVKEYRDMYDVPDQELTPALVQRLEDKSFEILKRAPKDILPYTAYGNEEESSKFVVAGRFGDYFKLQAAVGRAARRAGIGVTPTSGTSGYNPLRGIDAYEGYLKAAHDAGFKYDALAVHPYGSLDLGTVSNSDLDDDIARLIEQGRRYGYGDETPILFTECFNIPPLCVPEWGAGPTYDAYSSGKPTYDFGNREFIQAASAMRLYIICMKYWPRVQLANIWISRPHMDLHLTPTLVCKAVNTLGHLMGDVRYVADIRPAAGIRGYAFRLPDGTGIAPVWCTMSDVENGLKACPALTVRFGQPVTFTDFMGNPRRAAPDAHGDISMPISPAPLFVRAADPELLARALQDAATEDAASALSITFKPDAQGRIAATIKNLTGRAQKGALEIGAMKLPYALTGNGEATLELPDAGDGADAGRMHRWNAAYRLTTERGAPLADVWRMDYFYVTHCEGEPDWANIPAIPVTNRVADGNQRTFPPGDHDASFKMAWNDQAIHLRVEVADDKLLVDPAMWKLPKIEKTLWRVDGALEVYFDTGANGRSNAIKTFDNDDYRYDFAPTRDGRDGPGAVWRFREVYHQLADGTNMPTKDEASKKVVCRFERTAAGYAMTLVFARRYIEPIVLRPGFIAGCGLYLHDYDASNMQEHKGLSTASEPGAPCDYHPELWPFMVLR